MRTRISSMKNTCKDFNILARLDFYNVKMIYYTSLGICIFSIMRLIIISFSSISYVNRYYTLIIILTIFFSILTSTFTKYMINKKQQSVYKGTYRLFWLVFSMIIMTSGLSTVNQFNACLHFMAMMVIISLIPILNRTDLFSLILLDILFMSLLIFKYNIALELSYFMLLVISMGITISYIRYRNFLLKLQYKSRLHRALKLSVTDRLTGLLNRRGLEMNIESLWPHWVRQKSSIAFIMLDIDYFKKYNDNFGHVKGDECIKAVSEQIQKAIRRKTDFAARVGGEEFLICLSDIDSRDAIMWAKSLKASIESLEIKQSSNNFLPYITISMGLVCKKLSSSTMFPQLYNEADKSLYDAKEFGRACIAYNKKCFDQRYASDYKVFYGVDKSVSRFG